MAIQVLGDYDKDILWIGTENVYIFVCCTIKKKSIKNFTYCIIQSKIYVAYIKNKMFPK